MNAPEKPQSADRSLLGDAALREVKSTKKSFQTADLKWDPPSNLLTEATLSDELISQQGTSDWEPPTAVAVESLQIDTQRLEKSGFIVPNGARTQTVQEFRGVKRSLLLNAMPDGEEDTGLARLIMISSALPGEGKTFCAINLALSLVEEKDYSVLLVDGDVAKPSIPGVLGLPEKPGLIDALADPAVDVRSLIYDTSIPKLSFLSAGRAHHQATELLASSVMQELLDTLVGIDSRQIVIFDSPPLLVSTEGPGLPPKMGQIVLVVENGRTKRSAVRDALDLINRDDDSVTVLLNKATRRRSASGYGGYGYGYGYGRKG